jgi:hypothetical protein
MFADQAPCARCGRPQAVEELHLWTERRRLKRFERGRFHYIYDVHHVAVCAECYASLAQGGMVADVRARRGVLVLVGAIALAVAAVIATPFALPTLMSAFWRL